MEFINFLLSKTFFKNLIAAIILTIFIIFGLKFYLDSYTHHNDYHLVPQLKGKSVEEAENILNERKMNLVVIDTLEYHPDYPKFAILEQNPRHGDKVKLGRKIYVKINSGKYSNIPFPNILGKTQRQAQNILSATGLKIGKISKRPYFAEVVLRAIHKKDTLKPGMKIPKNSRIDLIVGDGKTPVESEGNGNEQTNKTDKIDSQVQKTLEDVLGK